MLGENRTELAVFVLSNVNVVWPDLLSASPDEDGPDCADAELYSEASSVMTNSKYSHSNSRISS